MHVMCVYEYHKHFHTKLDKLNWKCKFIGYIFWIKWLIWFWFRNNDGISNWVTSVIPCHMLHTHNENATAYEYVNLITYYEESLFYLKETNRTCSYIISIDYLHVNFVHRYNKHTFHYLFTLLTHTQIVASYKNIDAWKNQLSDEL